MTPSQERLRHYLILVAIMVFGTVLRFWNLDLKSLWLDEVLTAFFSLGHQYQELPLDHVFPLSNVEKILTLKSGVSCRDIAHTLALESTHPPLFFCVMHSWFRMVGVTHIVWAMRSLPALIGVGGILAIYSLNRFLFGKRAALLAAALMAVSPFAVYLSQEARHYTLPMALITLALLGLMKIQHSLYVQRQQPNPVIWISWGIINSIGCYVHYFFILAFIAQFLTMIGLMYGYQNKITRSSLIAIILVIIGIGCSYLPWISVLLTDINRPETNWLPTPQNIAPILQLIVGGLLMVIALPVENQSWWVVIPMALLMIGFGTWVGWQGGRGIYKLLQQDSSQLATITLLGFIITVLLEFLAIIYLLSKDISVAPRYNFVYYPGFCALLAASLSVAEQRKPFKKTLFILMVSLFSTILVVCNWVFLKPFEPEKVAQIMTQDPTVPMMLVLGYNDLQDIALGISFALAIEQTDQGNPERYLAFLNRKQGYKSIWKTLSTLSTDSSSPLNVWVVAPGLKRQDYPQILPMASQTTCTLDEAEHYRIGNFPYQLYHCSNR